MFTEGFTDTFAAVEVNPAGDETQEYVITGSPETFVNNCVEAPLQIDTLGRSMLPASTIFTVGAARVIPLNAIEPVVEIPVAVKVFAPVLAAPDFIHGKVVYWPIPMLASLPTKSVAK